MSEEKRKVSNVKKNTESTTKSNTSNKSADKNVNKNVNKSTNKSANKAVNKDVNKVVNKNNGSDKKTFVDNKEEKKNVNNAAKNEKNTDIHTQKNRKTVNKKVKWDEAVRKGFKHSSGFMFSLLINIVIVFVVIKLFSYAFNFAYSVFGDVAKDPIGKEYVVIEIPADSSTLQIGKALEDSGIIDDKYVFFAKVRIKDLGGEIKAGKYGLSSSMTYNEIINLICGIEEEEEGD